LDSAPIADVGNGNYSYIDSEKESQKVLDDEMRATFLTVAKDVKAQLEFNPNQVIEYRQIGYENRQLAREDFNNDKVDAGDIGAGKRVTVLYELVLKGSKGEVKADPLLYQNEKPKSDSGRELAFLKMRWKTPAGSKSELASLAINTPDQLAAFTDGSVDMRFTVAVAAFGQKLRHNAALDKTSWQTILDWADKAKGRDEHGYRQEFTGLVRTAKNLNN
jgi:Ca-activated chloride channel family protein